MVYEKTVQVQVTVPAGAAAGTRIKANFVDDPSKGPVDVITVPVTEHWLIEDVFVSAAPGVDLVLDIEKNLRRTLQRTPPLSTLNISQPGRAKVSPMLYRPGDMISATAITLAAGGASAVTVTAFMKIKVFESAAELVRYGVVPVAAPAR